MFRGPGLVLRRLGALHARRPTDIEILKKTQGSKVDPMRREAGPTYNSRALIDACKPFEWMDEFPAVAESSPEYIATIRKKWRQLF